MRHRILVTRFTAATIGAGSGLPGVAQGLHAKRLGALTILPRDNPAVASIWAIGADEMKRRVW